MHQEKVKRKAGIQSLFPEQTIFTVGLVRLRNHCHYHLVVIRDNRDKQILPDGVIVPLS